jgi:diaminopimelate epimerase
MNIPFTKAHGARNDFLLTWQPDLPAVADLNHLAIAICDRNTGIGADGWLLCSHPDSATPPPARACDIRIRLFNAADGGEVELSGNGTRCAAAWALSRGLAQGPEVKILTGAGPKSMTLLDHNGNHYNFRMNMGLPAYEANEVDTTIDADGKQYSCTILNVGNPQCAVIVDHFDFDWPHIGALLERHPRFPQRSNISFVKRIDNNTIDVRFFERGVGVTNSSGTGSTGAMAASVLRKLVQSPTAVNTPAGALQLSWEDSIYLVGPAELTAEGNFFYQPA